MNRKVVYKTCFRHRRVLGLSGWQAMMHEFEHNFDVMLVATSCDKCEETHEKKRNMEKAFAETK